MDSVSIDGIDYESALSAMEDYADQFREKPEEKPAEQPLTYDVIAETVCKEFKINPSEVNDNRKRTNADANKVIAKILNLKGYSHEKIADMVHSKRNTITSRISDYNIQYKFNKDFRQVSDRVFNNLHI